MQKPAFVTACLSVLGEGSLCGSSWGFFHCLFPPLNFFFLDMASFSSLESRVTHDVVPCTDRKAHWGIVIVILGYIKDLILICKRETSGSFSGELGHVSGNKTGCWFCFQLFSCRLNQISRNMIVSEPLTKYFFVPKHGIFTISNWS